MNHTMSVATAMNHMDPEQRDILAAMLEREGGSKNMLIDEAIKLFPSFNREEGLALLSLVGISDRNKFSAKLTFVHRCEILALTRMGYSRETLAKVYKVDRRTITHICNPTSAHYKKVREEELLVGYKQFQEKYVTHEVHLKVLAFRDDHKDKNNKFANRKMGLHVVQGHNCKYAHRVTIGWIEGGTHTVEVSGWYYRDLDSDFPDSWLTTSDPEALRTSQACYSAMLEDITDKLE